MDVVFDKLIKRNLKVEIVERKGLGHPDNIADNLADEFARELSKEYYKRFGVVMHHNVDKLEIVGGNAKVKFGGGKIVKKILIFYSGRATAKVGKEKIDLKKIAIESSKRWIKENFRFLNADKHISYEVATKEGAGNLRDIYKRKARYMGANDTSFGISYYPYSKLEEVTLKVEKFLNSKKIKKKYPYIGEDVKVLGLRVKDKVKFTIAIAFIDKFIESENDYFEKKEEVRGLIGNFLSKYYDKFEIYINTADARGRKEDGCYLTVTGTSSEHGDDGAVGRGNRINGLITPYRIMSLEAHAGKNAVNHVGKIYNIEAFVIAKRIYEEFGKENYVVLLSQIGRPINEPQVIHIIGNLDKEEKRKAKEIAIEELNKINLIKILFRKGKIGIDNLSKLKFI